MKKILFLMLSLLVATVLAACGGSDSEEKEVSAVESSDDNAESADNESKDEADEQDESDTKEFDKEIVDNDNFKATLVSIEKIVDKDWDEERFEIKFEVENKREDTIDVQAREVSADSKMIDESMLMMSQEVSGGKKADAVLTIENYDGDLPNMEEELEMILHIFSWDDMEFSEDYDVKVEFK